MPSSQLGLGATHSLCPQGTALEVECGQVKQLSENVMKAVVQRGLDPAEVGAQMSEESSDGNTGLNLSFGETASYNRNVFTS